jgi:cytochrome c oxidase accessory protein FixG
MNNQAKKTNVLPSLNRDGSRRWIRPRLAHGRFLRARRWVGYGLIALFASLPFINIGGRPAMLIDVGAAELSLFGMVFRPSDGFLLMLLGLTIVSTVLFVTAMFGRVWCGWACPQTVYLEFIFRPIERWSEGSVGQQLAIDERSGLSARRVIGWMIFVAVSFLVANIFLAYFVGASTLWLWISSSPGSHIAGFSAVAVVTALMFADFAFFREQVCTLACPYGRLQSALLDSQSLIVAYDSGRGEPRCSGKRKLPVLTEDRPSRGDCIDCGACVAVCPTGIDIRQGLQMECVGCAQCIDACDAVMDKIEQPRGLIRYTSQDLLAGKSKRLLRPRTLIYPALLLVAVSFLVARADSRNGTEVWVLRAEGVPFVTLGAGRVSSSVLLELENKSNQPREYQFELSNAPATASLRSPMVNWKVSAHSSQKVPLFVDVPATVFVNGQCGVDVIVKNGSATVTRLDVVLLGPYLATPVPSSKETP